MSRFDAVLLDFANTVVQFDRPQIEAIHAQLATYLCSSLAPIDAAALGAVMDRVCVQAPATEEQRELTPLEQMRRVLAEVYDRAFRTSDAIVVDANREYQELFVASIEIDDATRRALVRVRERVPVGLVSNYPCGDSLRRLLSALGIAGRFAPVVISGEVGYVKPHPKLFEIALDGLGVPAERVLFVGDSWASDMVGGHAAGMVTCHHLGLASPQDHEQRYARYRPDFAIHHLDELDEILDGSRSPAAVHWR